MTSPNHYTLHFADFQNDSAHSQNHTIVIPTLSIKDPSSEQDTRKWKQPKTMTPSQSSWLKKSHQGRTLQFDKKSLMLLSDAQSAQYLQGAVANFKRIVSEAFLLLPMLCLALILSRAKPNSPKQGTARGMVASIVVIDM